MLKKRITYITTGDNSIIATHIYFLDNEQECKQLLKESQSIIKYKINLEYSEDLEEQIINFIHESVPSGDVIFLLNEKIEPKENYYVETRTQKGHRFKLEGCKDRENI